MFAFYKLFKHKSMLHVLIRFSFQLSGLGVFSKDLVLAYAQKISCEYLNIRAVPGVDFVYPELYDQVLDIIKENAKVFEYHKVSGTHHVHLNDAASVAGIIISFLTSKTSL